MVIGAGAAGCVAAIKAAEAGASVALIEKNERIGRKLMITGKGRCNITNAKKWSQFSTHLHNKPAFFKTAFHEFSNTDTIEFFESLGVETVLTRDDRVFPASMLASTVVDALAKRIASLGIKTCFSSEVNHVADGSQGGFEVSYVQNTGNKFTQGTVRTKTVIVATGGLSYPATGSTGAGYDIARSFGHSIMPTFPSLTALTPEKYDRRLTDVTLVNVAASLMVGHDMVAYEFGDLQFTDGGIEGPVGFKLSRRAVWAMINGDKVKVTIDLKPAVPLDNLRERVSKQAREEGVSVIDFSKKVRPFLRKYMPQSIIDPFVEGNQLTLDNLAATMKDWRFPIAGYVGYRRAVVTAGGVCVDEVTSRSMVSRNRPGLYFAGEVLDIDGDTGGYNLQFAFSTGALAGRSAAAYAAEN